jgi:serine/threonine protein kinase
MALHSAQTILHRYVTLHPLGKGAMGEVWKGEHRDLEMPVAIKILSHPDQKALVARFRQEARLMSKLRHPNVVQIFDFGLLDDGTPCIVMEYLEGTPLNDVMAAKMPSWREAARYVIDMIHGLSAIHRAGIVHRDVKPENSMLLADGSLKIVDLGIAKPDTPMAGMKLTQTGTMIGTPYYMAPEQLLGQDAGPFTDMYALGIILYEMLGESVPWNDGTMGSILQRLRSPIPHVVGRDSTCPEELYALTMRLLEFETSARPDAAEALRVLERVLEHEPSLHSISSLDSEPEDEPEVKALPLAMTFKRKRKRPGGDASPAAPRSPAEKPDPSAHTSSTRVSARVPASKPSAPVITPQAYESTQLATPLPAAPERVRNVQATRSTAPTPIPLPGSLDEPDRIRAALVVKLPPSRLRQRPERAWLKSLLRQQGTGFTLGGQFWIAVLKARDDESVSEFLVSITDELTGRYAHLATSRSALVSEQFELTPAIMSGAKELPDEIRLLIQGILLEA